MSPSLQARLLVTLLTLLGLGWVALWAYVQFTAVDTAAADIDARLRRTAAGLLVGSAHGAVSQDKRATAGAPEAEEPANGPVHYTASLPEYELITLDRRVMARSPNFPADDPAAVAIRTGFSEARIGSEQWRFYTLVDRTRGVVCRVGERSGERDRRLAVLAAGFIEPLWWALPAMAVLVWLGVWLGLRPLRQISVELTTRGPDDLRPVGRDVRRIPREIHVLVETINTLLVRLKDSLARQRAFVAAAAHELRTPLAGFKAQAQVARRAEAVSYKERALGQLEDAIARMEKLITNLLQLARAGPERMRLQLEPVDLREVTERAVANVRERAASQEIDLLPELESDIPAVSGDAELLDSMLGNLLDNALRHSPQGATVRVTLARRAGGAELCVIDRGPGIPEAERARVFDEFYRLPNARPGGSGLGLAVVRAIVEAHGGQVELRDAPGGGTEARVTLPMASAR